MSFDVKQETDALPGRLIAAIALIAIVVIVVAVWTAARLLGGAGTRVHGASVSEVPRDEIGVVEQSLIERTDRAVRLKVVGETRLSSYGWIDRRNGVARVPIERAIDLYVERQRSAP